MVKYTNLQSLRYRSTGNAHHMMTVVNTVSLRVKLKILSSRRQDKTLALSLIFFLPSSFFLIYIRCLMLLTAVSGHHDPICVTQGITLHTLTLRSAWRPAVSDPPDYCLPGCSGQGLFQAGRLEWAAISYSRPSRLFPALAGNFFATAPPGAQPYTVLCVNYILKLAGKGE